MEFCGFTKFNKTVEDAGNILKAMFDTWFHVAWWRRVLFGW